MYFCEICNRPADIHHIVHRSEGGFEVELNYKYLCNSHHRGKLGPHHSLETDLRYKLEMQETLFIILNKPFYTLKELKLILNTSTNVIKRLTKNIKLYKEGYKSIDIIKTLMGGSIYTEDMIEDLHLDKILEKA